MLYIFLVDTGNMLTFDMNLALETVANLKKAIASRCQISEDKQVLLISGGESLDPDVRVYSYNSGTDTSPIFLFNKTAIETSTPPSCLSEYGQECDIQTRIESCLDMSPNYNTVVIRAELAQQVFETASDQLHLCERLVLDQHLQQQGWAAVVANLEDISNAFGNTTQQLQENFSSFIASRPAYLDLLNNFSNDLAQLAQIPVLSGLLSDSEIRNETTQDNFSLSLLQWISQKDSQSSLEQLAEQCLHGLNLFDETSLDNIKEEVKEIQLTSNNSNMKEVKGLEERLYGLEKLMREARKIVDEQRDLAQAFQKNQNRATNLRDASILPDLCASHQHQLQVMLKNHQQLQDIRRRCIKAKEELSENLHARLRWIMFVEKKLSDVDAKLLIYRENLRRLKHHLHLISQIHLAPKIYLASVVEVVRRRAFSQTFLRWANSLSEQSFALREREIETRQNFSTQFQSHFLQILFPGMSDFPPNFATEAPVLFDLELPRLCEKDIEFLRNALPEYAKDLQVPSLVPMPTVAEESSKNPTRSSSIKENLFESRQVVKPKESLPTSTLGQCERIAVLSCEVGDIVLIYFDETYESYCIFTLHNLLHFLHTDSLEALQLTGSGEHRQKWTIAEVTDKELCQARKPLNRYKVPMDKKFYRVRAKPWSKVDLLARGGLLPSNFTPSGSQSDANTQSTSRMTESCAPQNLFSDVKNK